MFARWRYQQDTVLIAYVTVFVYLLIRSRKTIDIVVKLSE